MIDDADIADELPYDPIEVDVRPISWAFAIFMATILSSLLMVGGLFYVLAIERGGEPTVLGPPGTAVAPPSGVPSVDADQFRELRDLRELERRILSEYEWIDRQTGIARIPIRRAMEILALSSGTVPAGQKAGSDAQ